MHCHNCGYRGGTISRISKLSKGNNIAMVPHTILYKAAVFKTICMPLSDMIQSSKITNVKKGQCPQDAHPETQMDHVIE
jgi:hypothetical protein